LVPLAFLASAGHSGPLPSQSSSMSHSPAAGRQIVLAGANAFAGQSLAIPSQASATSQGPAAARHSVPPGVFVSSGQAALEPVQVSARSHGPAAARQTVPALPAGRGHAAQALPAGCWHLLLSPSQPSAVHGLPSSAQVVPLALHVSAGHSGPLPVHVSATSHSPAAARHTVVAAANPSAGQSLLVPSQV